MVSASRLSSPRMSIAGPMYPAWNSLEATAADKALAEQHRNSVASHKSTSSRLHVPHSMGPKLRIAVPATSPRGSVSGPATTVEVAAAAAEAERSQGFWHRLGREFKPLPDWRTYSQ